MKNRYKAFISYSHADEAWARWLHKKLEHYRLPRSVRNAAQAGGGDLRPIFRDRDELASSGSLSAAILDALQRSDALIVICSPAAAKSKWVNQEILEFCRLQRADRVFCCIVEGDPPGVFPPAIAVLDEPLAADFRKTRDGRRAGLTKLVAGLLGLGLDDLRQREAQARRRRQAVVTGASAMGMVITTGLAAWAWLAQQRAVEEAARATALNDFMTQMLTAADPATLGNREVTVVEVLERASAAADETLRGQPEAEASARTLLGSTFNSLGKADAAVRELERALELRRQDPSTPDVEHASTLTALASAYGSRGNYDEEVPLLEEAITILEGLGDARLEKLASAYRDLAEVEILRSRFTEAERALDRCDEVLARMPSPQSKSLGEALVARGALAQYGQGDAARAQEFYRAALVETRKTGDRYLIAAGVNNVAVTEMHLGHLDEAADLMQEVIDIRVDLLGDGNPLVQHRRRHHQGGRLRSCPRVDRRRSAGVPGARRREEPGGGRCPEFARQGARGARRQRPRDGRLPHSARDRRRLWRASQPVPAADPRQYGVPPVPHRIAGGRPPDTRTRSHCPRPRQPESRDVVRDLQEAARVVFRRLSRATSSNPSAPAARCR